MHQEGSKQPKCQACGRDTELGDDEYCTACEELLSRDDSNKNAWTRVEDAYCG